MAPAAAPRLRIALVADELTRIGLQPDCELRNLTPLNWRWLLRTWRPDIVLVESAWAGVRNSWKYCIASYPDVPRRSNRKLEQMVAFARGRGIPTVFWNKEDGAHFDRFIKSACLFDHVLTVDENCLPRYRAMLPPAATVGTMMFPVQPLHHAFTGFRFETRRANFLGSYSHHIHDRRRERQRLLFEPAAGILGLTVFDRNSDRSSANYRYPQLAGMEVRPVVPVDRTGAIYREFVASLNVNTVEDSPTMISRRLMEIMACGGIAVTTPALSIERHFAGLVLAIDSEAEATEQFERLRHGPSADDLERARAAADLVAREHTWASRLVHLRRLAGLAG
jgi:spore maturation protein CgeB